MTSIRGKFTCYLTEKNFGMVCDDEGLQSLRRTGVVVKQMNPRGSKDNPEGGEMFRVGIGFMRLARENEEDTSQPRFRLLPPSSDKAVRTVGFTHRPEQGDWAFNVPAHSSQRGKGLFDQMKRVWKSQPVEMIFREGAEPPQVIIGMPTTYVPVNAAKLRKKGTLADAKGGEALQELASNMSHAGMDAQPAEEAEPPTLPPPAPEPEPDETKFGYAQVSLLSIRFKVPVTEVLRIADKWTRAGYVANKEVDM